jgi:hypothetical protein
MSNTENTPQMEAAEVVTDTAVEDAQILSETVDQPVAEQQQPQVAPLTMLATRAAHHFSTLDVCKQLETNLDALELQEGHTRTRNGLMTGFSAGFEEGYRYANQLLVQHVTPQEQPQE